MQRLHVGVDQRLLSLELLAEQRLDHRRIDVEQNRQGADIDDVLEQLTLPRVGVCRIADRGQRHADRGDVVAEHARRSEEHTSELQSLMRISYAVFCLKK